MLLSTRQICIKVMEHLTWKNVKAKVKYIMYNPKHKDFMFDVNNF